MVQEASRSHGLQEQAYVACRELAGQVDQHWRGQKLCGWLGHHHLPGLTSAAALLISARLQSTSSTRASRISAQNWPAVRARLWRGWAAPVATPGSCLLLYRSYRCRSSLLARSSRFETAFSATCSSGAAASHTTRRHAQPQLPPDACCTCLPCHLQGRWQAPQAAGPAVGHPTHHAATSTTLLGQMLSMWALPPWLCSWLQPAAAAPHSAGRRACLCVRHPAQEILHPQLHPGGSPGRKHCAICQHRPVPLKLALEDGAVLKEEHAPPMLLLCLPLSLVDCPCRVVQRAVALALPVLERALVPADGSSPPD